MNFPIDNYQIYFNKITINKNRLIYFSDISWASINEIFG